MKKLFTLLLLQFIFLSTVFSQSIIDRFEYDGAEHPFPLSDNDRGFSIINKTNDARAIVFRLTGADGGSARLDASTVLKNNIIHAGGGKGADIEIRFLIGTGRNEIPPGSTFYWIQGKKGTSGSDDTDAGVGFEYGAGGGGTGLLVKLPNGRTELLAVAGGGGGAYVGAFAWTTVDFETGDPGQIGTSGSSGNGGSSGSGGANGEGGKLGQFEILTAYSGGGGGYLSNGETDGCPAGDSNNWGGQKPGQASGWYYPGAGGMHCNCLCGGTGDYPIRNGGAGFGGGGSAQSGGGGGGGYSGGGGGGNTGRGGGGGSLVHYWSTYRINYQSGTTTSPGDGSMTYSIEVNPPTLGSYGSLSMVAGQNRTLTPSAVPTKAESITAYTMGPNATGFTGTLTVDPATGVVTVTNAKQAGSYFVNVKATSSGGISDNKTFTLTVTDPAGSDGTFGAKTDFGVDIGPQTVSVGDFNGDGEQDLAVANTGSKTLSILLGNGAGGFGAKTDFGIGGTTPFSVSVGDFNGDGKQDLAVANSGSGKVNILLGNGAGGFGAKTDFGTGIIPLSVSVGDFNGDGKQDLAVANNGSNSVSILLGNGAGGFAEKTDFGTGSRPISVSVGDFNGDLRQDLAVANNISNSVSILLGNGLGGFEPKTDLPVGTNPTNLSVGDFNGDGKQDLAVANVSSNTVSILLGMGDGTFGAKTDLVTGNRPYSVSVGDFNGDGKQDLAVANNTSNTLSIFLGDGVGGFAPKNDIGTGTNPGSVSVGDFNGDGTQDLAVSNYGSATISILLGVGPPPTLGSYGPMSVVVGQNTTLIPSAAPSYAASITASTSGANATAFTGTLTVNPVTGIVTVTNAKQAGIYPVTVKATNSNGDAITTTFNLTVTDPENTEGGFGGKTDFNTGSRPRSVSVGDFNGDGRQDLVVANFESDNVSLLLGNGAGGFGEKTDFDTGSSPWSVSVGDFNGDGKQDLAVANFYSDAVSILLGKGTGDFKAKTDYRTGQYPVSVSVGDFNGDGKQDLAMSNSGEASVSILLGDGDGTFGAKTDFRTGAVPYSVSVGDFNRDGKQDLAVSNFNSNTVSILLGDGGGGFAPKTDFVTGTKPSSVSVTDFNGDRKQDLAVAYQGTANISILLGNGTGGFAPKTDFETGTGIATVSVGDFNGDGKQDLSVGNAASSTVSILLGNGTGGFATKTDFSTGASPRSVSVGDFNGDGRQDLAVANYGSNNLSILLGVAPPPTLGSYGPQSMVAGENRILIPSVAPINAESINVYTSGANATSFTGTLTVDPATGVVTVTNAKQAGIYTVTVKAINSEGVAITITLDLTVTDPESSAGSFEPKTDFGTVSAPRSVSVGDFNGDGNQDLVVHNFSNTVGILLGNSTGGFGAKTDFGTGSNPSSVSVGDFNGDGNQDLAVSNYGSSTISILLGNGEGAFGEKTDFGTGANPLSVSVGDFNGDGKQDLAVANQNSNSVSILLGNGAGGFESKTDFGTGFTPRYVSVGDFNGDGRQDLVLANWNSDNVSILLGDGAGDFAAKTDFGTGSAPRSVAVGDFNGDGKQDLVVANLFSNTVSILLGDGAGGFGANTEFATGFRPYSVSVGDFNGDGKEDLAVTNDGSATVSILLGDGVGGFGAKTDFGTGSTPTSVSVGDFNQDGKQDLAVANQNSSSVSILLGTKIEVTFTDESFDFDGTAKNLEITGTLPAGISVSYTNNSRTNVGSEEVTATITGPNFTTLELKANLTVTEATLTVTVDSGQNKEYGSTDPVLTYKATGFGEGDDESILTGSLAREIGEDVDTYTINQGSVDAGVNYTINFTSDLFEITKATLMFTVDAGQNKKYGSSDPSLTYTPIGFKNGDTDAILTGSLVRDAGEDVTTYAVNEGTVDAGANYTINFISDNFEITKATLTVTVDAGQNKEYGSTDPSLTYTPTGFKNSDAEVILTGLLKRDAGENATTYAINQGTVDAGTNYTINFTSDVFEITKATLTVTVDAGQNKEYGSTDPSLTYTPTGFKNGDTDAILTGSLVRVAGEDVSTYAINQGSVDAGTNYTIDFTSDLFEITKATLTVAVDAGQNKEYGSSDPSLTYTPIGFKNGDMDAILTGSLVRDAGEDVTTYAVNQGTVDAGTNYTIDFTPDNFEITKATLTVTVDAGQNKEYGSTDPSFTYTPTGFKNGDTDAILSGSLVRVEGEDVTTYAISQGSVTAGTNYTINFISDNFEIRTATLTVTVDAVQNKEYGSTDPSLTYTPTGFKNGDTDAILTGSLVRDGGEDVSTYAINQGSVDAGDNYMINFNTDNFEITKATLTVTVDAGQNKKYGSTDPSLTYTPTGFKNGDTDAILTGSLVRDGGEDVTTYAINQGSVDAGTNYTINFASDVFEITKATLTVTADTGQSKLFGQIDPALTYTPTGFKNSDTDAILTGKLVRNAGEAVDRYTINQGTVDAGPNYRINFVAADFEIEAITIDASSSSVPVALGSSASLSAFVSPAAPGVKVDFLLDGASVGSSTSNESGQATLVINRPSLDVYRVTAVVGGTLEAVAFLTVYDPTLNQLIGGGWIDSPQGSFATDPAQTGKANFGFVFESKSVSKSKKGSPSPVAGNDEFQFNAGSLNFKSTLPEAGKLVIKNNTSEYQGDGTLNGVPGYNFTLTAVDGDVKRGTDPDMFRVQIWGTNGVIYDNGLDSNGKSGGTTALGGGSILIIEGNKKNKREIDPEFIEVAWNTPKASVEKQIAEFGENWFEGRKINMMIDLESYNPLAAGFYEIKVDVEANEWFILEEPITVNVLIADKPLATDIRMSNSIMFRDIHNGSVIGDLSTIDPVDNQHTYSIAEQSDFEVVGKSLIWKGTEIPASARVLVFSTDRAGQTIERAIELSREPRFGDFIMFPNPASSEVNVEVELEQSMNVGIRIYDAIGRLVYQEEGIQDGIATYQIAIDHLSPGLYTVQMKTGKLVMSKRLIKK